MIIWEYRGATPDGPVLRYGTPVMVFVPGVGQIQAVYQFGGGDQIEGVVHLPSGQFLAKVLPHHTGAPEQRARAAVQEALAGADPQAVHRRVHEAPVINHLPRVY